MSKHILKNDFLEIYYRTDALRIIGLTPAGKTNLLADMSDEPPISTPYGDFRFIGGHRLWHSPEALPRTYIPDSQVKVTEIDNGVILESQTEAGTGIQKRIEIRLAPDSPSVTLTHTLINEGLWTVELAPWAITQLRLGGTVILPTPVGNVDEAGLLHNRQFSLWPYASFDDPRLKLGDEYILFKADALPPFKIGYLNTHCWMAYYIDGVLFRKTFDADTRAIYPDNNCNAEMYGNDKFVELESLGALTKLDPGVFVQHVEKWEVFDGMDSLPDTVQRLLLSPEVK